MTMLIVRLAIVTTMGIILKDAQKYAIKNEIADTVVCVGWIILFGFILIITFL